MAKVFIGMPAYNGERYIEEAIRSLVAQSFTDWKLVISDDCSKDRTEAICKKFVSEDNRISYVRQEKNIGMDANFAYLLKISDFQSEYFMWAAQDDIWRKDFLKTCVNILDGEKDISVAFTGMINTDSYSRLIREYPHLPDFSGKASARTVIKHLMSPEIMGRGNLMYALIRSDLAKKINSLYESKIAWGADMIFAFGIVAHGGAKIDPCVLYEKRHGGYSNPDSTKNDKPDKAEMLIFNNPKNHMFPISKFREFLKGNLDVSTGTPYKPIVLLVLSLRSIRAIFIHIKTRNFKKFFKIYD